ncbi:MAG: carboxypeptidase regulatory-like domain-containing protein, partial [Candidatus Aenigmarchaeota archaeon]|nr:carboxypeptidase regulatory-like domain-containing protein [Candidatus Aenigmarchaeota archaeon]
MKKKIFFMLITMVILLTPSVIYAHTSPQGNGNTNFINAFFFYNAFPPSGQNIIIRDYFDNSGDPIIYNPGNVPLDAEVSFSKAVMGDVKVRKVSTSAEVLSIATKVSFGTSYDYQWNGLDSGTGKTAADGDYYLQVYAYESEATKNTAFDIQHVHIKIQRSTGTGETNTLTIYSLSPDKSQYAITDTINVKFMVVDSGSIVVSGAEVTAIWKDPNGVISQPMTCTTDGSGVCSKQFTSVTQAAGKYVVTATAAKTGYTTSDSKTLEVQVGTTGTSPVATNIPTCDSYCKGKEFKGGQCLATIPADWKY